MSKAQSTGTVRRMEHQHETSAMAELLDLDAEVLHAHLTEVTGWVHELAAGLPSSRILDLGCGTGTGALRLLERFDGAQAIAVDVSAALLERLAHKARHLGVADRIRIVEADLDAAWPDIGTVDLAWASNSLHHMADPDRVLTDAFTALRPGGLLVVAEMGAFPRFLPEDFGNDLEARCQAALAHRIPHLGDDWSARLRKAGFTVPAERTFTIDLKPPLPAATGRYAQMSLRRMRAHLDGLVSTDDLATLDTLTADGHLFGDDLGVRATRTVWVAAR
jgi:SAM-dependent methyltransferase